MVSTLIFCVLPEGAQTKPKKLHDQLFCMQTPQSVVRSMFTAPVQATPIPPAATILPPVVERLAMHLKVNPHQLSAVSASTLGVAVTEMQLNAADRAEIDIWTVGQKGLEGAARAAAAPMDATAILANEVRRQTETKMFPWAAQEEAVRRLIGTYAEEYGLRVSLLFLLGDAEPAYISKQPLVSVASRASASCHDTV